MTLMTRTTRTTRRSRLDSMDGEANAADPSGYDRFEALARKLVRVPKEEIERERDREKARKG